MRHKQSLALIIGTTIAFTAWELIGHWFLMAIPMSARHALDIVVGTAMALLIAAVAIHAIQRQHKELQELARVRDYLLRMQTHYLRLFPAKRMHPNQQLEYRTLELKYVDVQQRLASEQPATRVGAILALHGLARTHVPEMHEPYPFFSRVDSHLTAALCLEAELAPREQAVHALQELAEFARDNDSRLLYPLIEDLAHTNRVALTALIDALSERFATIDAVTDADLKQILTLVRFTSKEATDEGILNDLMDSAPYQESLASRRVLARANSARKPDDALQLNTIRVDAMALRDTRDALAHALRCLPPPADLPEEDAIRRFWQRRQPVGLHACFLAGAELNEAQLQGVDLRQASMEAVNLTDAQLQRADLTDANLWRAQLFSARLEYAKLWSANLRDTSLTATHLEGADMSRAHLQGAHLVGANLKDTCLWQISIADGDTKRDNGADFGQANWWESRFTDALSGSTDMEVQNWLKHMFPKPVPEGDRDPNVPENPFDYAPMDLGTFIKRTAGSL